MLFTASLVASTPLLALAVPSEYWHQHADAAKQDAANAIKIKAFGPSQLSTTLRAGNVPYGSIIERCTVPGTVALSFDDGPFNYTSHVLDLLDEYQARATFFVNGVNYGRGRIDDNTTAWPSTLQRMMSSGHQIGSHTWSHVDLSQADAATRRWQVDVLAAALDRAIGMRPRYLRPPYGSCGPACLGDLRDLGYHVINWNVDTKDYLHNTPDTIHRSMNTFSQAVVANGSATNSYLVLSHDVHQTTAKYLAPYMLATLQERGYRAVTVGECLGDAREN